MLFPDDYTFIGGYDKHSTDIYYWLDNTEVNRGYHNWAPGQPTSGHSANQMAIGPHHSGTTRWKWFDIYDNAPQYYLCEILVA